MDQLVIFTVASVVGIIVGAGVTLGLVRSGSVEESFVATPAPEPLIFGTHHFIANEDSGDVEPWTVYPYATDASGHWNGFSVASRECAVTLMETLDAYVVSHGR